MVYSAAVAAAAYIQWFMSAALVHQQQWMMCRLYTVDTHGVCYVGGRYKCQSFSA